MFKEIGGFDPAYFMYVEDADLTQKGAAEGHRLAGPAVFRHPCVAPRPHARCGKFKMQLVVSMGRYFKKWAVEKGTV